MACINHDGSLTRPGRAIINAMRQPTTLAQVAQTSGIPLYRVRSVIRELIDANLVAYKGEIYTATELGLKKLES